MAACDVHEDALRAREALLLVESVLDYAIFRLDPTGRVASWNPGAERIKGYREDEILGQHFSRFYTPEDVASGKCERMLAAAARDGRAEDEGWRVRKDGSRFWASVVMTAIHDAQGEIIGYAKVTRDLTERRNAEEERLRLARAEEANRLKDELLARERDAHLATEEARSALLTTLQSIGDAVIATDDHGNVTMMNPVAERLTGWKVAEARGMSLSAVFHIVNEETRRVVESPVHRVLREGVVVGLANHTLLVSRDGAETPIQDSGAPIRDAAGNVRGVVLVFRDATEETRANQRRDFLAEAMAVLSSSLDYRDTLARVAQLLVPRLADWCSIDVLEEGDRLVEVGASHVDPIKLELARALRKKYPPVTDAPRGVLRVIQSGRPKLFPVITDEMLAEGAEDDEHLRLVRALRPTSAIIVPLFAGVRARALGAATLVFTDSGRRYAPSDLAFAEDLARRAAGAIENARLYAREQRARDMADAASRAKDEFLAGISHELRTPLSAILGWAKMLPVLDDKKRARAAETIERNAAGMARLIDDLLDVSRITSGKLRLDLAVVQLVPVVEAAVDAVLPAAGAKSVQIEQRLDADAGPVHGDPGRLQQVVWNLVTNAVKFTPAGGRVLVSLARRGDQAEIAVKDTGKGIDPAFLPHVFDPFRQADAGVARGAGGLGLGLSIVKELVELHGGKVHAESEGQGRGATFVVRLPVRAKATRAHGDASDEAPPQSLPQLVGLRVLVVDDEPDMRELLCEILSECRSEVTAAGSVAEAMNVFERGGAPDVLVSDISMPGETGYDLIRRVRALPADQGGGVPAAALTALTRAEDRRHVLSAGFQLHVPKPVEPAELVTVVATLARLAAP
jgi:PAS domain S-box-containing protein